MSEILKRYQRNLAFNYILGGRHSSVVTSMATILRLQVRIPRSPSMLFSICIIEIVLRIERKKQKEAWIGAFKKIILNLLIREHSL